MSVEDLKIISVAGAHSNVGKTTLCSILINELKGFGAIKFTKTPIYTSLVEDLEILGRKDKDTAVFLKAGAEKVLWIRSPYEGLEDVLETAVNRMTGLNGIIVEGNSPVDFLNPHLIVLIVRPGEEFKPSAIRVAKKADVVIINSDKMTQNPEVIRNVIRKNTKFFLIDLIKRKGEISDFLSFVKAGIDKEKN